MLEEGWVGCSAGVCLLAGWLAGLMACSPPPCNNPMCSSADPAGACPGEKEGGEEGDGLGESGGALRRFHRRRVCARYFLCVHEASGVRCAKEGAPCAASQGIHADPWPHEVRRWGACHVARSAFLFHVMNNPLVSRTWIGKGGGMGGRWPTSMPGMTQDLIM